MIKLILETLLIISLYTIYNTGEKISLEVADRKSMLLLINSLISFTQAQAFHNQLCLGWGSGSWKYAIVSDQWAFWSPFPSSFRTQSGCTGFPMCPSLPPPRLDQVALSLLKLTYVTETLTALWWFSFLSPLDPEILMGRITCLLCPYFLNNAQCRKCCQEYFLI